MGFSKEIPFKSLSYLLSPKQIYGQLKRPVALSESIGSSGALKTLKTLG